jgi:glycosyltransferase involved in cell wall biosynthesis
MKVLVVNPIPVYPVKAMSQMRTSNMLRVLSGSFDVTLACPVTSDDELSESVHSAQLGDFSFIPLISNKNRENIIKKRWWQFREYFGYIVFGTDKEYTGYKYYKRQVTDIVEKYDFQVVISNYWEGSSFLPNLKKGVYKVLDPHYCVSENLKVFKEQGGNILNNFFEYRRLKKNLKLEKKILGWCDLSLPLSKVNFDEFKKIYPLKPSILVEDGSDLDYYIDFPKYPDPLTILFYGAMNSKQNIKAFWRLYANIFPELKKEFPSLKLIVVGANPEKRILALHNNIDIIVSGFVEDVRPYLSSAWISVIPLELGSGFRGRVIELMAMGIPVIGTYNALESIGFENAKQGFITDSDKEMIKYARELILSPALHDMVRDSALRFVRDRYSLESTFGLIRDFFQFFK